jgi:hypothetical protein
MDTLYQIFRSVVDVRLLVFQLDRFIPSGYFCSTRGYPLFIPSNIHFTADENERNHPQQPGYKFDQQKTVYQENAPNAVAALLHLHPVLTLARVSPGLEMPGIGIVVRTARPVVNVGIGTET